MKTKPIQSMPMGIRSNLDITRLTDAELDLYNQLDEETALAKMAEHAAATWETKQSNGNKTVQKNTVIWQDPDMSVKHTINQHPATAWRCYQKNPAWWSVEEIAEVASNSWQVAFQVMISMKLNLEQLTKLQLAAGHIPEQAYRLAREVPGLVSGVAEAQLSRSPYWLWRLATEQNPDSMANENLKIEALAPYNPEAAGFILFRSASPHEDSERKKVAMATLQFHPEAAFKTALNLQALPLNKNDWRMKELKAICMRSPQWAFHWARDIDPEYADAYLEECANHPGWAIELVNLIRQTQSEEVGQAAIQQLFTRYKSSEDEAGLYNAFDPWFLAFMIWLCDNMNQESKRE